MNYIHLVQYHSMAGGGVGSVVKDVGEAMAEKSKNVCVLSMFQNPKVDFEASKDWGRKHGITVELLQKPGKSRLNALFALRKRLRELSKDGAILYMHLKWPVLGGILASLGMRKIKRVEVYHSGYMRYKLQAFFARPFIKRYIAVSRESKQQLIEWFHIKPQKIEVVYNGVNIDAIRALASAAPMRELSEKSFVSVGRIHFQKGFEYSVEAFKRLHAQGASYTVVGYGGALNKLKESAQNSVEFTGRLERSRIYALLNQCDCVVIPSLWEGNSIFLLEALAVGKPVAITDIPSFRETFGFAPLNENEDVRKESFGYVFKKESVEACRKAFEAALKEDRETLTQMGKHNYKLAEGFSSEIQAERYMGILAVSC